MSDRGKQYFFGARGDWLIGAVCLASSSAFLLLGWDQGVLGGLLSNEDLVHVLGNPSASKLGIIVAVYDLGCLAGGIVTMIWGERLGRRRATMIGLSIMLVGASVQTSTYSAAQMIAGRVITGLGNGMNSATIPAWNSEMTKPHNRGRLNAFSGSMIGAGICISYWVDYGLSFAHGHDVRWRLPIGMQMIFAAVTLVMTFFLPESPRWLIAHDRVDEGVHVLACLESKDATADTPAVVARRMDIQIALTAEHAAGPLRWAELWEDSNTGNRRRVILACGIMVFQQMSGVNSLVYYVPYLLENSVGLPVNTSLLVAGLVGVIFVTFSVYAIFFIDRWGRRKPFIITSVLQALSMALVAILLSLDNKAASMASVTFFFTYMAAFGTCYLGVPWSYAPELLPLRLRARGSAIASAVNWTCNFIIVEITPSAITNIGWRTYIIFAVLNFTWAPLLYFFYPETARKTMEEIDNLFVKGEKIEFHTGDVDEGVSKSVESGVEQIELRTPPKEL